MANYGVIDLGSNSIRMVIYEVEGARHLRGSHKEPSTEKDFSFHSLINDKVIAGLSAYVDNGVFTKDGVNRAVEVLTGHLLRAKYFKCKRIDIFATAVLRNCKNSSQAVRDIEDALQARINLLSAQEEAHLGFVGASFGTKIVKGTLIDIGGGSTELTKIKDGLDTYNVSLPMGSVAAYAQHVNVVLPREDELENIREAFLEQLDTLPDRNRFRSEVMYGIGGSARAAAKMCGMLKDSTMRPKTLSRKDLDGLLDLMKSDESAFAHYAVKAVPERVHTLAPGCVILSTIMNEFGGSILQICKFGLREGYLLERILL